MAHRLQRDGERAYHVSTIQIQQNRGSSVASQSFNLGGALVRNDVDVVLDTVKEVMSTLKDSESE